MKLQKTFGLIVLTVAALAGMPRMATAQMATPQLTLSVSASAKQPTIITFDFPGALETEAVAINNSGSITGAYLAADDTVHGFVRAPDGAFTSIDAPGAEGTVGYSINPRGEIAGYYDDASSVRHGFLRARDGSFITFEAPGSGTGARQGTQGLDINTPGEVAGQYTDASGVYHGFVRSRDGTITTFDAPSAGTSPGQGTTLSTVDGLNPAGALTGGYNNMGSLSNGTQVFHSFVRAPDGTFTEFDVPGAGTGPGQGTNVGGINPSGTIQGYYADPSSVFHGYVRDPDGTITTFDVAGAGTGSGQGTFPANINPAGVIPGWYVDSSGVNHGFVRTPDGGITTFDVPGAGTGPARAPSLLATTRRGRLRDTTLTLQGCYTASCGRRIEIKRTAREMSGPGVRAALISPSKRTPSSPFELHLEGGLRSGRGPRSG